MILLTVLLNKKGSSLVEVMISLVILLVVFLALMQTALLSIDSNVKNLLRDEAVSVAAMRMSEARNLPFNLPTPAAPYLTSDIATLDTTGCSVSSPCPTGFPTTGSVVKRNFRNITSFCFCTNRTVTAPANDTKQVNITVGWKWKGVDNPLYTISTIVRSQ